MRRPLLGLILLALTLTACSDTHPDSATRNGAGGASEAGQAPNATADCNTVLRFEGARYSEVSRSDTAGDELGEAEVSACSDTGTNAKGVWFPDDAQRVTVYAVDGASSVQKIAWPVGGSYRVLVRLDISLVADPSARVHAFDLPSSGWEVGDGAEQALGGGRLVVRDGCTYANGAPVLWPAGFSATQDATGAVTVYGIEGQVVARSGEVFSAGGGFGPSNTPECGKVHGAFYMQDDMTGADE